MDNFQRYNARMNSFNANFSLFNKLPGFPPFAPVRKEMGEGYPIGRGENRLVVAIKNLLRHVLILGESGSGKTVCLAFFVIMNALALKFMWMDAIKTDGRHLLRYLPNVRVHSYELRTIRDNPLEAPAGVSDNEWGSIFSDVFSQQLQMVSGAGSYQYLYNALRELKNLVHPRTPTLKDLYEFMKSKNEPRYSENYKYRERILPRLAAIIEDLGDSIDCSRGYRCEDMQDPNFHEVIELPNKPDTSSLISDLFLYRNLKSRMKLAPESRGKTICYIIDEAKRSFGVHKARARFTGSMDNLSILMSSGREFGQAFIISDQDKDALHPIIPSLCDTFVKFHTNADNTFRIGRIMGLSNDEIAWLQEKGLRVGQAIIKTGNFPPVLMNVPNFDFRKDVTDEEIRL